jgi:hypothetical protein
MVDLEPMGYNGSDTRFNDCKSLMIAIKSGIGSGKITGFSPPKFAATAGEWSWHSTYYYYMGLYVDFVAAMTYDIGITNGPQYQAWMRQQTTNILRAVSGEYASKPAPTNGVKVYMGLPAFPIKYHISGTIIHDPAAENTLYGCPGLEQGVQDLLNDTGDPSENYFNGASVYLHVDGVTANGYALYSTDWWRFGKLWLGAWGW